MKYADINRAFTDMVQKCLSMGWTINTASMSGSQGEVAKVDFTDGKQIARAMLEKRYDSEMSVEYYCISLAISGKDSRVKPNLMRSNTLWNRDLEVIEEVSFYRASVMCDVDWFVSRDIAMKNAEKWYGRASQRANGRSEDISQKAAPVVLGYVRKHKGCKTAKAKDIRVIREKRGFVIYYKDHVWQLQ